MKIELYDSAKHWEEIKKMLFEDTEWSVLLGKDGWIHDPEDSCTFWDFKIVGTVNEKVVWYCFWGNVDSLEKYWYINKLYIHKHFRQKWYAKVLLDRSKEYYKQIWITQLRIKVFAINKIAVDFYKRYWFQYKGCHEESCNLWDLNFYHLNLK